jgi:bacterial leucyl aminopeptidase
MFVLLILALSASIVSALSAPTQQVALGGQDAEAPERYLIETTPGETQWVTEDQKWALRRVRASFVETPKAI